ncbi:MAG TPA: cellulase family glycosylhydrolase [Mycobacteriales bacterium]|nr:cellulase family glycosylhydrolase [Mycobacteriales bacterium]
MRGRTRLGVAAVAAGLVLVPAVATSAHPGTPTAPAPTLEQLHHDGRWLTDSAGRVVFLHGINAVYKRPPYVAPDTAAGFTAKDADLLAAHGINAVRLGVLFAGVMPTEGVIDQSYLDGIDRIVQLLAARHIWVLLDFHQDAFNERFAGEGFPAWAVHDDGLPFANAGSFFANYVTSPAVQRAYDHFWNNDFHLVDDYAQAWKAVASRWHAQPYLMGYDLFNEPSAGSQTLTCANPLGCPLFDATMAKIYDQVRTAIRTVDPTSMVWEEEQFFFNAISAGNLPHVDDANVGFSWHDYACTPAFVEGGVLPGDPDCTVNEPRVMSNAEKQVAALGGGSLLSEFGAGDDLEDLTRLTNLADSHLVGWMYWAYKHWDDPTGGTNEGLFKDDANPATIKSAKLDVLAHTYPQAVAGTPTALRWEADIKTMTLTYTPRRSTGLTDVFIPPGEYANGYKTVVTNGHVVSDRAATGGGRHVLVDADGTATVTVVVKPGAGATVASGNGTLDGPTKSGRRPPVTSAGGGLAATGLGVGLPVIAGAVLLGAALASRHGRRPHRPR